VTCYLSTNQCWIKRSDFRL